jgi:hypothetical protein
VLLHGLPAFCPVFNIAQHLEAETEAFDLEECIE